jgi:hypothetical protein
MITVVVVYMYAPVQDFRFIFGFYPSLPLLQRY